MATSKAVSVKTSRTGILAGKTLGGARQALAWLARIATGKPDLRKDPKTARILAIEGKARFFVGLAAMFGGLGMALLMGSPGSHGLAALADAVMGGVWGQAIGMIAMLGVSGLGVAACGWGMGSMLALDEASVEWLEAESEKPGLVREYCARAALAGRGLSRGECQALMAWESKRVVEAHWAWIDGLADSGEVDSSAESVGLRKTMLSKTIDWAMLGDKVPEAALTKKEMRNAKACVVGAYVGLAILGIAVAGFEVHGLGSAAGVVDELVFLLGTLIGLSGVMGAAYAASVDMSLDDSTLSEIIKESRRDPIFASRLAMVRSKGREVSQREARMLLFEYSEKRRVASSDRLFGAAKQEALAASLAAPSIERATRGNEGSRLLLVGLSSPGDERVR